MSRWRREDWPPQAHLRRGDLAWGGQRGEKGERLEDRTDRNDFVFAPYYPLTSAESRQLVSSYRRSHIMHIP